MIRNVTRVPIRFTGDEDVVILPLFQGSRELKGPAKKLDVLCRSGISNYIKTVGFKPRIDETALIAFQLPKAPHHVLLLGLGDKKSMTPGRMANAAGNASKAVKTRGFRSCHILFDVFTELVDCEELSRAFLKGFLLAQYSFSLKSKRSAKTTIGKAVILSDEARKTAEAIKTSRIVVNWTSYVRDLVNRPADDLTPERMGQEAEALSEKHGLKCRIMKRKELEKLKMGAVLSVARGSREEPRFITIHYNEGAASRNGCPKVCLVGKGVTFDSGGLSIKPWQSMNEMKGDMAGGAVVMGVLAAASQFKLPLEIIGLIPCVENMPDGTAFRPGDVITTYSGKTIEIISTDAEGRLILADALAYSREFKPDVVVDLATLTGSVIIALGTRIAGVVGTNQDYVDRLVAAGNAAGERVWQLPLDESFSESIKGDISDFKNFSGRDGSTITAAALLHEFVGKTPWIHVDIAGTFWAQDAKVSYQTKGATGYGVDLTLRFLDLIASGKRAD